VTILTTVTDYIGEWSLFSRGGREL